MPTLSGGGECLPDTASCPFVSANLFDVGGGATQGIDFQLRPGHLISGYVTDAASGYGIAGVQVVACETFGSFVRATASTMTAADGGYTLSHVIGDDPGAYVWTSNDLGYVDQAWPGQPLHAGSCPIADPLAFASADQNLGGIDFSLDRGATVAGTVSQPASAQTVELWIAENDAVLLAWSGSTDANGSYLADDLSSGTYYAVTRSGDHADCRVYAGFDCIDANASPAFDRAQASPIVIGAGQMVEHVDFPAQQVIFVGNFDE